MNFGNGNVPPENVSRMCDLLVHRGPDEGGYHFLPHLVLGIRRLKVIGVVNGSQPVHSPLQRATCVFNGEIYNYIELKEWLEKEGYVFQTNTDAEVIVHLYDRLGIESLKRLRGMFALAIYDDVHRRLILARDCAGKKPLNYAETSSGGVVFASEIGALISHPEINKEINREAIDRFLSFRIIPAPLTIYRDVHKVKPGTAMVFERGRMTEQRYWSFDFTERHQEKTEAELIQTIDELLVDAVRVRLQSEVPLGALLSGGLDSSLIVSIMSQMIQEPMHTFSIGFADRNFNELDYAKMVSDYCGTIHHQSLISPASALSVFDELLLKFGEPYAFPSAIACYFMNRLARQYVTVALTGDGADELFCGYNRYKIFAAMPDLPNHHRLSGKVDLKLLAKADGDISAEYQSVLTDGLRDSVKREIYSRDFWSHLPADFPVNYLQERFGRNAHLGDRLSRAMEVDCNFWLSDAQLVKIDIASMAHSVEVRCPMLDQKLVEFVSGIGTRHKLADGQEKRILKRVAQKYLPPAITQRQKKELAVPLENWLATSLRAEISNVLLSDEALSRGYFDPDRLIPFVNNYGPSDSYAVWTLYVLEQWHKLNGSSGAESSSEQSELALQEV
ncbi:MAG: asparagine synthase (glutamine-hydrolyzing) [Pyrinomonadaceae bacterium]|nr:asparagine synthase (glutamine-hydrolyzing) [Pyrinomonadaceae bacterium]